MDTQRTSKAATGLTSQLRAAAITSLAILMAAVVGCGGEIGDPVNTATGQIVDQQDGIEAFQRDVFVIVGSSLKNPDDTTAPDAQLFNVAGVALNLTWGQFSGASSTSTAECLADGTTDVNITLTGLVPNGVYSLFYGTFGPDSSNPACPGVERTLPLESVCAPANPGGTNGSHPGHDPGTDPQPDHGDDDQHGHHRHYTHHHHVVHHGHHPGHHHDGDHHDGDDHDGDDDDGNGGSTTSACTPSPDFVASATGTATFHGTAPGCLLDATQVFFSLVYHFDGQTYGSLPNKGESVTQGPMCRSSFGDDAMRQILILQKW